LSQSIAPFPGTSRFEIRSRLGEGAVGVVYEAYDRERKTTVAIKSLRKPSADTILLLKKEFRAVQDIQHPNLVQLGELFEEGGEWFFTMEFVRGMSLLQYVRMPPTSHRHFDEARLRASLTQLARGLQALHAAHKVHCDVKPSNVMVTAEGRVVILDFGITTDLLRRRRDASDTITGTALYMAPEQAACETVGSPADWYAVGVVLYQALTGELPFGGTVNQVLEKKLIEEPPPPHTRAADLPADLDALCIDLLRLEPSERPAQREILRRLGAEGDDPAVGPSANEAVFVGRRDEDAALARAFADARAGRGVTQYVHGESGVGKSFLVRHFIDRAQAEDAAAIVFHGRCYERESVPYKAVDGVIDDLREHLAALAPGERDPLLPDDIDVLAQVFPVLAEFARGERSATLTDVVNRHELRLRAFAALRELLDRLARAAPLLIAIDDMQWADTDSLALLAEVTRPPNAPPLLLLATMRSETDVSRKSRVDAHALPGDVRHIHLDKLPPGDAEELIKALLGAGALPAGTAADAEIRAIADDANGHPLFIDELVRQRRTQGGAGAVVRLDDALWGRNERVDPAARRLVETIAIAGLPITQHVAGIAAVMDAAQIFRSISVLRSARLVRTAGVGQKDTIEPYHDRVRVAVLAHIDAAARKEWHGRLALALEIAADADPEMLATHWHEAGDITRASRYTVAAGERASAALAFDRAARLFRRAIELGVPEGDDRRVRRALAEALTNAGRVAEAADVRLTLAADASPAEALHLRRQAAEQFLCSGHFDRGLALLRETLAAAHVRFPESPVLLVLLLVVFRLMLRIRGVAFVERDEMSIPTEMLVRVDTTRSAGSGFSMSDVVRGSYFQTRSLAYALSAGEPHRVMRALAMETCFTASGGAKTAKRTARLLEETRAICRRLDTPESTGMASVAAAYASFFLADWAAAKTHLIQAESIFRDRCRGVTFELTTVRTMLYRTLGYLGQLTELARRVEPVMREIEHQGDISSSISFGANAMAILGLAADDPERVRALLAAATAQLSKARFLVQHVFCLVASLQRDLYCGEGMVAFERIEAAWPRLEASLLMRVQPTRVFALAYRARCAIAAAPGAGARRDGLLDIAASDIVLLERERYVWGTAEATVLRATLADARGDRATALDRIAAATRGFEAMHMGLHAAAARRKHGEWLGGGEGASLVSAADEWMRSEAIRNPARMAASVVPAGS
jgi:hypothetical protein